MPLIYQELKQLARGYLRGERPDHTLQPTALIHEAYIRLADQSLPQWQNRAHFYGIAARVMRQILVDHARRHQASKRGSDHQKVPLDEAIVFTEDRAADVIALDDALKELAAFDDRKCRVIELRFFGGLSLEETAEALGDLDRHGRPGAAPGERLAAPPDEAKALTPERWRQVQQVFEGAADLPA